MNQGSRTIKLLKISLVAVHCYADSTVNIVVAITITITVINQSINPGFLKWPK